MPKTREQRLQQKRDYYERNKDEISKKIKKLYEKNKDKYNKNRRDKYNLLGEKYKTNTQICWKRQGIKFFNDTIDKYMECKFCELCNVELKILGKITKDKKVLEHDHLSGYCRFICCQSCNIKQRTRDNLKMKLHLELYRYFKIKKI